MTPPEDRDAAPAPAPADPEARYRELLVALYERLTFRGISRTGKAISLLLEDVYVDLQAVSDAPEAAEGYSPDERRLLLDAEAGGTTDAEARMALDGLRVDRWRREGRGGETRRSVEAALAEPGRPGLVILGDPGSGKSTLLHALALREAKGVERLPIFVPLAAYDDWLRRSGAATPLGEFLAVYYKEWHGLDGLGPVFRRALDAGRALVLLDGLDEVLDVGTRQHVASEARALLQGETGRGNRFVVTSRIVGYREAALAGDWPHVTVCDFGEGEIASFAHKWCEACEVWLADGQRSEAALGRARAEEAALVEEVRANESVLRLAANPLLLTMLALLRRQGGRLPEERVKLYQRYVEALLDNNWESVRSEGARTREPERFDQRVATDYLIELALWLQQNKPSGMARRVDIEAALVGIALRLDGLDPEGAPASARKGAEDKAARFLQDMGHFAGLLTEWGRDAFGFSHLTFQEYFAGRALARMEAEERWAILRPNLHRARWREPILLCAGQLGIVEGRGKAVSDLGRRVLGAESPYEGLLHRDVFLLSAMAADNVGLDMALLDELAGRLMNLAEDRVRKVRADALGGLAGLVRMDNVGAALWLEGRIQNKRRVDETALAVKGVLGRESGAGLRRAILGWFGDADRDVRNMAVSIFGALVSSDTEVRRLTLDMLNDSEQRVRCEAISAVRPLVASDAEVRRLILGKLEDTADGVRALAAQALGSRASSDAEVRRLILDRLDDQNYGMNWGAFDALAQLVTSDAEVRNVILDSLDHSDATQRLHAIFALKRLVLDDNEVRQRLINMLNDPDVSVRGMVVDALGRLVSIDAGVRQLILDKIDDPEAYIRWRAVSVLTSVVASDDEARRLILDKISDPNSMVRLEVLAALAQSDDATVGVQVASVAINVLDDAGLPWSKLSPHMRTLARTSAATVLGQLDRAYRDDAILARLIRVLQEESDEDVLDAAYKSVLRLAEAPELISPPAAGPEPGIVDLRRIEIDNLRAFDTLPLAPPERPSTADEGRWIVILGENGTGKSTLLRGLVFALATPGITSAVLSSSTVSFRRVGSEFGEVRVHLGARGFRTRIKPQPQADSEIAEQLGDEHTRHPLLFAYGCRRGSALGGSQKEVSFTPLGEVVTLFDEAEGLIHAETWLTRLRLAAALGQEKQDDHPRRIFDTVIDVLCTVLPGIDRIEVEADHVYLSGSAIGERVPLAALSDGYLTTLGWIIDLVARWMNRRESVGPIEAGFNTTMEGLVLVDELDLHLHPRWQVRVIDDLRRAFPRMSFVVTTHNPLTLLGSRPGEIFVLRREHDGAPIQAEQRDLPKGLRADQILTGPWFGLASTLDDDTLALLDQHRAMLRGSVPEADPGRQAIEAELRRRLGGFAETSLERLALQVAAELMEEERRDLTPEERQGLRDKVKALVRKRREAPKP